MRRRIDYRSVFFYLSHFLLAVWTEIKQQSLVEDIFGILKSKQSTNLIFSPNEWTEIDRNINSSRSEY